MNVGFVGVGAMGGPMTRVLAEAGHSMRIFDTDDDVVARVSELNGVMAGKSAHDVVAASDVTFSCLPNDDITRSVYLDADGMVAALSSGKCTVDCSTVSPSVNEDIAAAAQARGGFHFDASMLGSTPQAETGEIGFVVGGDKDALAKIQPLLDALGRFTTYAGPTGSANQIKLIHQTLVANQAVAVAEAVALCVKSGADLDCFFDVVCNAGGFAHSRYLENRVPRMREGDFSALFMLDLMTKDAKLGQKLAETSGVALPLLATVIKRFEDAQDSGLGRDDFSAVAKVYEDAIGRKFSDG